VNAVLVNVDRMFLEQRKQIAALAAKYAIPAMYTSRQYVEAGGLMSYEASAVSCGSAASQPSIVARCWSSLDGMRILFL
jgi:hypothetical protein